MNDTVKQQRVKLPKFVLDCVAVIAADPALAPGDKLFGIFMLIYGYAWYDRTDSIDPTALAIPEEQWGEIAAMLTKSEREGVSATNLALDFMNRGPSAYKEDAK